MYVIPLPLRRVRTSGSGTSGGSWPGLFAKRVLYNPMCAVSSCHKPVQGAWNRLSNRNSSCEKEFRPCQRSLHRTYMYIYFCNTLTLALPVYYVHRYTPYIPTTCICSAEHIHGWHVVKILVLRTAQETLGRRRGNTRRSCARSSPQVCRARQGKQRQGRRTERPWCRRPELSRGPK